MRKQLLFLMIEEASSSPNIGGTRPVRGLVLAPEKTAKHTTTGHAALRCVAHPDRKAGATIRPVAVVDRAGMRAAPARYLASTQRHPFGLSLAEALRRA